jgi:RimJ/RimL family protein N-acetyltransferase
MIIHKYGITLSRITAKDIELVRRKRNSAFVSQHMIYREHISPEMQKKWFAKVNTDKHIYFIIRHGRKKIGLTHAGNIDWKKGTAEGGIFLWDKDYVNTPIPVIVSLISFELFFRIFKFKKSHIRILKENKKAIVFNEMMGFKKIPGNSGKEYDEYSLTVKDYISKSKDLLAYVRKMTGDNRPLDMSDISFSGYTSATDRKLFKALSSSL